MKGGVHRSVFNASSFPDSKQVPTKSFSRLQGPVVQSIVSLTSSLRGQLVKCFMTL